MFLESSIHVTTTGKMNTLLTPRPSFSSTIPSLLHGLGSESDTCSDTCSESDTCNSLSSPTRDNNLLKSSLQGLRRLLTSWDEQNLRQNVGEDIHEVKDKDLSRGASGFPTVMSLLYSVDSDV